MNKLKKAFKNISELEPPFGLETAILSQIRLRMDGQKIRRKLILSYAGLIGSVMLGIYTSLTFGASFFQSDFWNVFSLIFSDAGVVLSHWQDFLSSLTETFPAVTLAIILIPVFLFILSIYSYLNLTSKNYHKYI